MISTKSVVASSDQRTVCSDFSPFFEHGVNFGHRSVVRQSRLFAVQGFLNLGLKPLVVAGFLFFSLELGNDGG